MAVGIGLEQDHAAKETASGMVPSASETKPYVLMCFHVTI